MKFKLCQLLPTLEEARCGENKLKFELVKYLRAGPTNTALAENNTPACLRDSSGDDRRCCPLSHFPFEHPEKLKRELRQMKMA